MVGRIETEDGGRATGVHYQREGRWRFQKARNVVVAGYAIETPRLLLNVGERAQFPRVSRTAQASSARTSWCRPTRRSGAIVDEEIRSYKGPPSLAITEHWNYEDRGKDFFGGYCIYEPGSAADALGGTHVERPRPVGPGARR